MLVPSASTVEVRAESQGDALAIRSVHEQAFGGPLEARLVEMLRSADRVVLSLVAVAEGNVLGHVLFSPVTVEPPSPDLRWVALGPIGVLPAHQGRGIGSRLVREGLDRCRSMDCDGVVLVGAPEYYSRFGFVQGKRVGNDERVRRRSGFPGNRATAGRAGGVRGHHTLRAGVQEGDGAPVRLTVASNPKVFRDSLRREVKS